MPTATPTPPDARTVAPAFQVSITKLTSRIADIDRRIAALRPDDPGNERPKLVADRARWQGVLDGLRTADAFTGPTYEELRKTVEDLKVANSALALQVANLKDTVEARDAEIENLTALISSAKAEPVAENPAS